jgi:ribonuclease J
MVTLKFFGGVNEIGGNKILLDDGGTRVLFDFGQSFTFGADYFTDWLSPRSIDGLKDHFEFGLLPKIRGLYAKEMLAFTDFPYAEPEIDAIFLSHAHFDHVTHICFVDSQIPVYLGVGTKLFLESMEETSGFCDYRKHEYHTFRTGRRIKIDDVVVEPLHVDHSIPAAYGFLIHASEGTVVYTGDLRMHGPRRDLSEEFVNRAKECEPDALVCEGTRMALKERRRNYSEEQVEQISDEIVSSTDKIVFIAHYSRDMDRLRTFYNVAVKNGRNIVISPKTACLLSKLIQDEHLHLPDPLKDERIHVYYKRKKSGTYDDGDYFLWERQFMDKMVNCEFVQKNQDNLIMDLDFYQFAELIDIRPKRGSHFIHSMSEPFSEEDIQDKVLHNWLEHFGMLFHQLHASGHLNRQQIGSMVTEINAKTVFPVHTENQHMFKQITRNAKMIKPEKQYRI